MAKIKYRLLEHFINEGRLEDTIKKYTGKLPEPVVKELSQNDPSGNNKYLDWMVRTVIQAPNEKADIITKIKCYHENVNRLSDNHVKAIYGEDKWRNPSAEHLAVLDKIRKTPKDINAYPSHLWIKPMCEYFEEQKPKNASRVKIFEDDKWLVVSPLTHSASCSYGAYSNWCVSTSNSSYFGNHTQNGILVFFIDKQGSNPRKKEANQYKFAVNINYDRPSLEDWDWYSMEDQRVDARLMMNLVPKQLLNLTQNYLKEITDELSKKSAIDEKELNANSELSVRIGTYYYVFPKFDSWDETSMLQKTSYLNKYNGGRPFESLSRYKESGLPYFIIQPRNGRMPTISMHTASWSPAINNRDTRTGLIPIQPIIDGLGNRFGGFNFVNSMNAEQKQKFINLYREMFNKAQLSRNQEVRTSELAVGDSIVYRPNGRGWGNSENVTVTRVAEKSLMLSNGKRIARTATNWKSKILGIMRIVDQLPTNESRWIRKRII